jgi:hypothetical protein
VRPRKKTIFLITESEKDYIVFKTILERRGHDVAVKRLSDRKGSISELARDLRRLIQTALLERQRGDCIVVLHDADMQSHPFEEERKTYKAIQTICETEFSGQVILILAYDEHESWILADEGFCAAYQQKPRNRDNEKHPSKILEDLLHKHNKRWRVEDLESVLKPLNVTGDKVSPSMREAFEKLQECGCLA